MLTAVRTQSALNLPTLSPSYMAAVSRISNRASIFVGAKSCWAHAGVSHYLPIRSAAVAPTEISPEWLEASQSTSTVFGRDIGNSLRRRKPCSLYYIFPTFIVHRMSQ